MTNTDTEATVEAASQVLATGLLGLRQWLLTMPPDATVGIIGASGSCLITTWVESHVDTAGEHLATSINAFHVVDSDYETKHDLPLGPTLINVPSAFDLSGEYGAHRTAAEALVVLDWVERITQ